MTEKHDRDILGQVNMPLTDLTTFRTNRPLRMPLQPHKKCPNAVGELVFEAWVSEGLLQQQSGDMTMTSREDEYDHKASLPVGLRKLKDKLTSQQSPVLHRCVCCIEYLTFFILVVCLSLQFGSLTVSCTKFHHNRLIYFADIS